MELTHCNFERLLVREQACGKAISWLRRGRHRGLYAAWRACPRGDWLAWLAVVLGVEEPAVARVMVAEAGRALARVSGGPGWTAPEIADWAAHLRACGSFLDAGFAPGTRDSLPGMRPRWKSGANELARLDYSRPGVRTCAVAALSMVSPSRWERACDVGESLRLSAIELAHGPDYPHDYSVSDLAPEKELARQARAVRAAVPWRAVREALAAREED